MEMERSSLARQTEAEIVIASWEDELEQEAPVAWTPGCRAVGGEEEKGPIAAVKLGCWCSNVTRGKQHAFGQLPIRMAVQR